MRALIRNASKDALQHLFFPGRFLWRLPAASQAVALTFDDGPHPIHTPAMLDMLGRAGVRATFFVIGREVDKHPAIARRIVEEGHAIGGHSYDHTVITSQSHQALIHDLEHCRDAIAQATGTRTSLFRPPKGEVNISAIRTVCGAGFKLVHWTKTFSDYKQDGVAALIGRIESAPPIAGDVLLFHDQNAFTVEALVTQLPRWRQKGLAFQAL
jgi:peptidoglycan/xylan/chitin deacetylase (PgdA/CDA1 family)